MIQFEKQRSEAAHKKYLDTVAESKHAVDVRRYASTLPPSLLLPPPTPHLSTSTDTNEKSSSTP